MTGVVVFPLLFKCISISLQEVCISAAGNAAFGIYNNTKLS